MNKKRKIKLQYIKWVDSIGGNSDWTAIEKMKDEVVIECYSTGFLFDENEKYVFLVPHWHPRYDGEDDGLQIDGFGDIAIPKQCILERKTLKMIEVKQ